MNLFFGLSCNLVKLGFEELGTIGAVGLLPPKTV